MVDRRKKKTKIRDKESQQEEGLIRNLHEPLIISEILTRLSTKDAVRTSVLSKRWRYIWKSVPELDLDLYEFSNANAFVSYVERFLDSHRESWIRKLRLDLGYHHRICGVMSWIDAVTRRSIQHLDFSYRCTDEIPVSIYTCKTLVHLRLRWTRLPNAEFVSLPCLKIMHLECIRVTSETILEKLISGSPVLEDLKVSICSKQMSIIQVRSHTLMRINMKKDESSEFVIDAPQLQCIRTKIASNKNYQIISSGFPAKLDIDMQSIYPIVRPPKKVIRDILTDIRRVRDLVIISDLLKDFFLYSKSRPLRQFRNLYRLNARFAVCDLEMLPALLQSCTKLESLTLDICKYASSHYEEKREPNVMFAAVPRCLVSSLKFVELKLSDIRYKGEMELARYLLKNSTILEKFRLNVYHKEKAKCDYLTELVAMTRCSSACQVVVL